MKSYKNWSGEQRLEMFGQFKLLKKLNRLPKSIKLEGDCEMCGYTKTMPHAEEYGPTLNDYLDNIHILCVRCHSMLHLRFSYPKKWEEYVDYIDKVRKKEVHRLKPLGHMGVLFQQCKYWKKEKTDYTPKKRGKWWEKLSITK